MQLRFTGIETRIFEAFGGGAPDAHGRAPLRQKGAGLGPCRHCLGLMTEAEEKLILAYRPFEARHPYAEVGPIFLHTHACPRFDADEAPAWFAHLDPAIVRGYGHDDWIRYETGAAIEGSGVTEAVRNILRDPEIAYAHVRSKFGCLMCRVDREAST